MNLRDLDYVLAVAELRHFGKAARQCHVSQPTLSMQIKKLELSLGISLFERVNKDVLVTPVGQKILVYARNMRQNADDIKKIAKAAQDPLAGEFRLGAFPTLAPYFLPLALPKISSKLPKLKLLLVEEKTGQLLEKLKTGELDAALIALPVADEMLNSTALFDDPFMLAVAPDHRLAKRKHIRQEDLRSEDLLLLEDGHCLRDQALQLCTMIGSSGRQDFRATSLETLRQMVGLGAGITLMPRLAQKKDDGIVYIPFIEPVPFRSIGLVWRKGEARRICAETLVDLLKQRHHPYDNPIDRAQSSKKGQSWKTSRIK